MGKVAIGMKAAILIFLTSLTANAVELKADSATVALFFRLQGMESKLKPFPGKVLSEFSEHKVKITPVLHEELDKILKEGFSGEKLLGQLTEAVSSRVDERDLNVMITAYQDPFLSRMHRLAAKEPERGEGFDDDPAFKRKLPLLRRLDEALQSSDFKIKLQLGVRRATMASLNALFNLGRKVDDRQLQSQLEIIERQERPAIQKEQLAHFYRVFKSLPDADFEKYVKQVESPEQARVVKAVGQALVDSVGPLSEAVSRKLLALREKHGVFFRN